MPSLALQSFVQFAAPEAPVRAPRFRCAGAPASFHFASPRRLLRAREVPTSRLVASMAQREVLEPFTLLPDPVTQEDDLSALSHIMEPIHEGDKDLLLVYCPGALKASETYFALMDEIQAQSSLRLWIVVLYNTDREALSTAKVVASLPGVLARLKERGFRPGSSEIENVFIAGHSIGAWVSRWVAVRWAQGFIQMGSSFDPKVDNLAQHPKPVLTLGGGLDGQMVPAVIAKHAGEVLASEPALGPFNTRATKPVVIIPGMNHAQFCDGRVNVERGDVAAAISQADALRRAGELVAAFLAVQAEGAASAPGARGLEILTKAVTDTHARYKPLWESLANQAANAAAHQLHVASNLALSADNITALHHDFRDNFVISKPWVDTVTKRVYLMTYLSPAGKGGLSNLWVKMKSREALSRIFEPASDDPARAPAAIASLGKEINTRTFETALSVVGDEERELFLQRGKKLRFVDDWLFQTSATAWIESDLSFTPTASGDVEVRTPVLLSPVNMPPRFAGMHYMKVLTLANALHWILIDSFR